MQDFINFVMLVLASIASMLLGVLAAATILELNTPQNETFGGIPLLCVVIGLWLLPGWAGLLVAAAALAQPIVLLDVGEWRSLTAEFQFIAVAIVTVVETLTVPVPAVAGWPTGWPGS